MCYDVKYALRLCSEHEKQRACVHIYSTMGLFEEAVDLSLKVSCINDSCGKMCWIAISSPVSNYSDFVCRCLGFKPKASTILGFKLLLFH